MPSAIVRSGRLNVPGWHAARCLGDFAPDRRHSLAYLRFEPLLFRFLLHPMYVAHRGRAPVASRPCKEILEGVEILAPDTTAFFQQGGEVVRPGAEGFGLFQQHRMTGERLLESRSKRHGIALRASALAQIIVCRQNFLTASGEGGDSLGMTPAEGGAPDIPRDTGQGVVVRRCQGFQRSSLSFLD